jgi:hypothetical protein
MLMMDEKARRINVQAQQDEVIVELRDQTVQFHAYFSIPHLL